MPASKFATEYARITFRLKLAKEYWAEPRPTLQALARKYKMGYGTIHTLLKEAGATEKQRSH